MGPYCKYCGQRCFTHFPTETPQKILDAYNETYNRSIDIIATCKQGQAAEKEKCGYCYDDIINIIRAECAKKLVEALNDLLAGFLHEYDEAECRVKCREALAEWEKVKP